MSLKSIRINRLKQLQSDRRITGPAELGKLIGKSTSQAADLLSGRAPFGEKVARSIEESAGLPDGWLDQVGEGSDADSLDSEGGPAQKQLSEFSPTSARDYRTIIHTLAKTIKDANLQLSIDQFLLMADGIYKQWGEEAQPKKSQKGKVPS